MATNVTENKNYPTEPKRINHALTFKNGDALAFADILTNEVEVFDELGNTVTPDDVAEGNEFNVLTYTVDTTTFRAGNITARVNITFNSVDFPASEARDIIEIIIFKMDDLT